VNSPSGKHRKKKSEEGEKADGKEQDKALRSSSARTFLPSSVARLSALIVVIVLAAALLANSMTKEVSRDEQMYCTAGVLLGQGQMIYRDFSYPSQLPYHPLLLAALYRSLGTTHYLLAGRLVSVLCDILAVVFILLIYRSVFSPERRAGLLLGLAATVLYVFNPLVDYAAGYAWNHDVVILCVVASLWLFVTTDFQKGSRFWRMGLVGALLTFATCMRVTTALVELLFLAAVLVTAGGPVLNRLRTALPFCGAALVVALWPLWVIAQAPQAFWLNLVQIPSLYGRWLHEIGRTFNKIALTIEALTQPGYLVLLALSIYFAVRLWQTRSRLDRVERQKVVVVGLLPPLFFVIAYIPPTMWHQYWAVPVPFLAIALAYPLVALRRHAEESGIRRGYRVACGLVGAAALVTVLAYPVVWHRCLFLAVPERWTPVELHSLSVKIGASLREPGPVLTLGPLQALEGGRDIYPELSCGSVVYRVADRMAAPERQITHTVGPGTLPELVRAHPPAGVIVGIEPSYFASLEEPLRKLVPPDWLRDTYGDTLQVYRRR
jgi:4-amino-4-deoxy-L-arabinose transferase-like glycosyltransferase